MLKVLLIEDHLDLIMAYQAILEGHFELTVCDQISTARECFERQGDSLFAIVFDGNVSGETSVAFACEVKKHYKGIMIANSDKDELQQELLQYCRYGSTARSMRKLEVPTLLFQLRDEQTLKDQQKRSA